MILLLFARYLFKSTCQNEKEKIYIQESNLHPSACTTIERTFGLNQLSDINNTKKIAFVKMRFAQFKYKAE